MTKNNLCETLHISIMVNIQEMLAIVILTFNLNYLCVRVRVRVRVCIHTCLFELVKVRGQPFRSIFQCASWGLDSGFKTWQLAVVIQQVGILTQFRIYFPFVPPRDDYICL